MPPSAQTSTADIDIALRAESLAVGETRLQITLTDANGSRSLRKKIDVRGDMNHAGMQPVLAEITTGENGVYDVPFEWTMGGDWIVTVKVTMPDGTTAEQRFDLSVTGG